jgi:pyruvate formate-lyase activating enzyme-like uncharacterized protein
LLSWLLSFYLAVIIVKYINNNRDSFININNFNLKEEGANLKCLKDNNSNPIIPLSNTLLRTIIKEDKKGNRPIYSL